MQIHDKKEHIWKYFDELVGVVQKVALDKRLLKEFLIDILTPRELEEISKRWQIIKMLQSETPHHKIAGELHIGVGTVTRGSREMRNKHGGFQLALAKLRK